MFQKFSIAMLLLLASGLTCAGTNIGGNAVWRGTKIEVSGLSAGFDLQALLDNITDASATKPYQIVLGPGVYNVTGQIKMKPYIDISGSGEGTTKIFGNHSFPYGLVELSNNTTLSNISVESSATGSTIVAIYADTLSTDYTTHLVNVRAKATGIATNSTRGIWLENSDITMTHVTAEATGNYRNYAVRNYGSSPVMRDVTAIANSGSSRNWGVYVSQSTAAPVLEETTTTATGVNSIGREYYK